MTALNEDRILLSHFLRELLEVNPPTNPRKLLVLEQQYPGEEEPGEDELERRGIPDGWIFDEESWCIFIETKVIAKLGSDQIRRHRRTAENRGFEHIIAVAIAPVLPAPLPSGTIPLEWRNVYAWLRRRGSDSKWAAMAADYLEIAEAKLIDTGQFREGTLTMFSGFPFGPDQQFTYLEGKRVLKLALNELRTRRDLLHRLGINPKSPGRASITGRQGDAVWDFLSLSMASDESKFTNYPHLTLRVGSQDVRAMVTVPDNVNRVTKQKLKGSGEAGFQALVEDIVSNLKPLLRNHKGAAPWFRGVQRRWRTQREAPFVDASIEFDLRTAIPSGGPPKTQPRGCPLLTGLSSTKKARTTSFKWAWSLTMCAAQSFERLMRLI